ncbi:MAG: dimethyl sulfoxide reductase anchor subunit [Eggerthellaceae bacterium]|nr:dimethyl sulfoxide reductase anchor subunit [Eggerthellaceae bacterium]
MSMEILPLLLFTTCGGLAAGAYAVDTLCVSGHGAPAASKRAWLFPLTCLVLLGVGLLGTLAHLGQPLRFINGMMNPASMISQESYWAIAFGVVLVADLVLTKTKGEPNRVLRWVGTVTAFGLMTAMSLAYFDALGLPGWNTAATLPFFVLGDLGAGAALATLFAPADRAGEVYRACIAGAIAWAVSVAAYALYLAAIGMEATMALGLGALIGPVAVGVVSALHLGGKLDAKAAAAAVCALAVIGLVIVRAVFFMAGIGA